jgi:PadR family transcriptional regulator PadR
MNEPKSELLHGTLDLLVLQVLSSTPLHGYAIAKELQQLSNDVLQIEQGSLYPALYRMEKRGWLKSNWGISEKNRRARVYQLTRAGRSQLASESSGWKQFVGAVSKVLKET